MVAPISNTTENTLLGDPTKPSTTTTTTSGGAVLPPDATPIYTASDNPLLTSDPSVGYGTRPPTGTSAIAPDPVGTATAPSTSTTTTSSTSTVTPDPVGTATSGTTTGGTTTSGTTTKESPTGTVTISGVPLLGTGISGILGSLGGLGGGGGVAESESGGIATIEKKPNYWIYIIIAGTIVYLLAKKKKK